MKHMILLSLILTWLPLSRSEGTQATLEAPPLAAPVFPERSFSVKDYGATGKGVVNDTPAINAAIAACNKAGGGMVFFPEGSYLVASVRLLSHVHLRLDAKALITGALEGYELPETNPWDMYQDFGHSQFRNAMLWGEDLEDVAISGGTINGGGITITDPQPGGGDKVIAIRRGSNLDFRDIRHEKGGHFVYLLNDCENVSIRNITILRSRDGVDLMGCRNVRIQGCRFTGCGDDTVGIKSDYALGRKIRSSDIYVWSCYFETGCNAVQFGSETAGDFSNVKVWDIEVGRAEKAGIGITCNDGGVIDGVEFRHFRMRRAANPVFILLTDRLRTGEKGQAVGAIRNIRISDVEAVEVVPGSWKQTAACTISGLPGHPIENLVMEDICITYKGGGTREQGEIVVPYTQYFAPRGLGIRPASGLYARHVKGLVLRRVTFQFEEPDLRPALILLDVDGIEIRSLDTRPPKGVETLRLEDVKKVDIAGIPGLADQRLEEVRSLRLTAAP